MAQLFDFKKVTVGPRALAAVVELAPSAPLMTSDNPEATSLVLELMPALANHVCLGDAAPTFGEVAADTELAHLLEHVTVELLAQTDAAGDITSGQTVQIAERTYEVTITCVDDVLVAGALSSAAWILQWAYSGGGDPRPDVQAIAGGLVSLVQSVSVEPGSGSAEESIVEDEPASEPTQGSEVVTDSEGLASSESAPGQPDLPAEPESGLEPQSDSQRALDAQRPDGPADPEPAQPSLWDLNNVPRPHAIR